MNRSSPVRKPTPCPRMGYGTMKRFLTLASAILLTSSLASAQTTHFVSVDSNFFDPADLTICVGDTVQWDWVSGFHNVESGVGGVHDGNFLSGPATFAPATFSVTFDQAFLTANPMPNNVYPYYCIVHLGLNQVGSISVAPASATSRNGSGLNPLLLTNLTPPAIGTSWDVQLDCTGNAAGQAALLGFVSPSQGTFIPAGELLVGGPRLFSFFRTHTSSVVTYSSAIPNDSSFCGLQLSAQGVCFGTPPGARLSNAIDLEVGG